MYRLRAVSRRHVRGVTTLPTEWVALAKAVRSFFNGCARLFF